MFYFNIFYMEVIEHVISLNFPRCIRDETSLFFTLNPLVLDQHIRCVLGDSAVIKSAVVSWNFEVSLEILIKWN